MSDDRQQSHDAMMSNINLVAERHLNMTWARDNIDVIASLRPGPNGEPARCVVVPAGTEGSDFFEKAIGKQHIPTVSGKHVAAHYTVIRRVYEEAKTRYPEAADVIATLVWLRNIDTNRERFIAAAQEPGHD